MAFIKVTEFDKDEFDKDEFDKDEFDKDSAAQPISDMGVIGNIGAGVGIAGIGVGVAMSRAQCVEVRSIVGANLHAGTMSHSSAITRLATLGATGPEISAEIQNYHSSGTPQAERSRKMHGGKYDLEARQYEVAIHRSPMDVLTGSSGEFTLRPIAATSASRGSNMASIHQPRRDYTTAQSEPLYPIYSTPYTGDRTLFNPLNLVILAGGFLTSFAIFNMISNKIYNGVWITPKPLTVFEIIEQLNLKKLTQGQASQLLQKYHDYSRNEAASVLTGEKVGADTINLDQKDFFTKSVDEPTSKKLPLE